MVRILLYLGGMSCFPLHSLVSFGAGLAVVVSEHKEQRRGVAQETEVIALGKVKLRRVTALDRENLRTETGWQFANPVSHGR